MTVQTFAARQTACCGSGLGFLVGIDVTGLESPRDLIELNSFVHQLYHVSLLLLHWEILPTTTVPTHTGGGSGLRVN